MYIYIIVYVYVFLFLQKEVMASSSSLASMDWGDSSAQSLRGKDDSKPLLVGSIALLHTRVKGIYSIYVCIHTVTTGLPY